RVEKIHVQNLEEDKIVLLRHMMIGSLLGRIQAIYSSGFEMKEMVPMLIEAIDLSSLSWSGNRKFIGSEGVELDQYSLGTYDEMLWMLSLGYLLGISTEDFEKLVNIIDEDGIKDKLFEFIISTKIRTRSLLGQESYKNGWKLFGKLREAIGAKDKAQAESLIKGFLEKDWYKEHKNVGWYDNHKGKHDTYSGYWCFESGAIVAIMDLDDSSFRDNEYYPKDLVDYYRENKD
ncbi:MAG: PoNe immunity protein domain-containing protein, partial [Bacteroidota bacterium]